MSDLPTDSAKVIQKQGRNILIIGHAGQRMVIEAADLPTFIKCAAVLVAENALPPEAKMLLATAFKKR